jgi:UDP-N-acetylmuramate--alanine ligase
MTLFAPDGDFRPVHFMGIAGAGMSALALLAKLRGVPITGCDNDTSGAADLEALGVPVWQGHDPAHLDEARAVVVTAAVPTDHPELARARAQGLAVMRRADALGAVVSGATVVAVAGTHGKTTTTAMCTQALVAAGRDPTGLVGGRIAVWGGNARIGGTSLYVVEADEFDKAFLSLSPTVALINNVEADHLECYGGSTEALERAFVQFATPAARAIVGTDDPGAARVAAALPGPVWRVGTESGTDIRISAVELGPDGSRARVTLPGGRAVALRLQVPGLHNVRNAAAALGAVAALDAELGPAVDALASFTGAARRFERVGEAGGVTVVDDYAHHPTEVRATLAAARQAFPGRRIVAVFQPHLYSRTALHGAALWRELAAADAVFLAPVYAAREQPLPGVTSELVAAGARAGGRSPVTVTDRRALAGRVAHDVQSGDVVLTLGAGDVTRVGPDLLALLGQPAAGSGTRGNR